MELPKWEMSNDGLITCSSLQHEKALLYTFVETALAHNNKLLPQVLEEVTIKDFEPSKEDIAFNKSLEKSKKLLNEMREENDRAWTKIEVSKLLQGKYNSVGISRWWHRARKGLDGLTPTQMWEIDPQRVIDIATEYPNTGKG